MGKYVAIPYYGTFRIGYKQFVGPVKKTYLTDKEIINLLYRYDPSGAKIPIYAIDPYNETVKTQIKSEKDLLIPEDELFHRVKSTPVVEEKPVVNEVPKTEIDEVVEEVATEDTIPTITEEVQAVEEITETPIIETPNDSEVVTEEVENKEQETQETSEAAIENAVDETRTETIKIATHTNNSKNNYKSNYKKNKRY